MAIVTFLLYNPLIVQKNRYIIDVRFEGAQHKLGASNDRAVNDLGGGRANSRAWPGVVVSRMKDYAPVAVAIDSTSSEYGEHSLSFEDKLWALYLTPNKITQSLDVDELSIICGDVSSFTPEPSLLSSVARFGTYGFLGSKAVKAVAGIHDIGYFAHQDRRGGEPITPEEIKKRRAEIERRRSRRAFLGRMAWIGAGIAVAAPRHASVLLSEIESHKAQALARGFADSEDHTDPLNIGDRFDKHYDTIVDGRTALLIEKARTATQVIEHSRSDTVGVLMGNAHNWRANEFLDNRSSRLSAIRDLYERGLDTIEARVHEESLSPESYAAELRRFTKRLVTSTELGYKDPDVERFSADPVAETDRAITVRQHIFHQTIADQIYDIYPEYVDLLFDMVFQKGLPKIVTTH